MSESQVLASELSQTKEWTVVGIQARMGSTRLPGKSLMPLRHQPMLRWVIDRVRLSQHVDEVWILTTTNPEDDALANAFTDVVPIIRGDVHDVASRYQQLFQSTRASRVFRITGDCPLIDGRLLDKVIALHDRQHADYTHILAQPYYDLSYPNGFNAELFTIEAFERMRQLGSSTAAREHVTLPIDHYPEKFNIARLAPSPRLSRPDWKLSVDTQTDFDRVAAIVDALGSTAVKASVEDIVAALDAHPQWYPSSPSHHLT